MKPPVRKKSKKRRLPWDGSSDADDASSLPADLQPPRKSSRTPRHMSQTYTDHDYVCYDDDSVDVS